MSKLFFAGLSVPLLFLIAAATAAPPPPDPANAAGKAPRDAVVGDAIGNDPILRESVLLWTEDHSGELEIRKLAPEALTAPDNGCDAAVTDAADELTFGDGFTVIPYALEPALIAVPRDSGLANLTREQLKHIYSGRIANWNKLGLDDRPILRAGVLPDAPGGRAFQVRIMGRKLLNPAPPKPGDEILPGMITYRRLSEAEALAADASGVILFGSWELASSPRLKLVAVDGVRPEADAIRAGRYFPTLTRVAFCRRGGALEPFLRRLPEIFTRRPDRIADFLPPPVKK